MPKTNPKPKPDGAESVNEPHRARSTKSHLTKRGAIAIILAMCLNRQMQALASLFQKFERRARARWWMGTLPEVRHSKLPEAILAHINLPDAGQQPFSLNSLVRLTRPEAAHVLAVAGSTSLAYGTATPRTSIVREAKSALTELGDDAVFFGNGKWETAPLQTWQPLTSATFECGVVGFNDESAFVFWAEDED